MPYVLTYFIQIVPALAPHKHSFSPISFTPRKLAIMRQKKRVLISILQMHKTAAGAMRNTFEQIRYFQSRDCEVHVISDMMDKKAVRQAGAIPHTTVRWPGLGTRRRQFYSWQVLLWSKYFKPDLVVGHGDLAQQDVLCLHNCVHLAHELIHGTQLSENAEMYPIHTPQLKNHRFKHLIANSHLMRNDLAQRFKIPLEDMSVVYPAYDHHKFTPVNRTQREIIRQRFGLTQDDIVVGLITSGNFKKRGVDIFFAALEKLTPELKTKIKFWLVGKDRPGQFPTGLDIKQMPVINDVENYYRALDIFVLPARVEEFGRVQLEAMACGVSVISTKHVGCSELIGAAGQNYVLKDLNADELCKKISELALNQETRNTLAKNAIEEAKTSSEEVLAPKFDKVFLPLLGGK